MVLFIFNKMPDEIDAENKNRNIANTEIPECIQTLYSEGHRRLRRDYACAYCGMNRHWYKITDKQCQDINDCR